MKLHKVIYEAKAGELKLEDELIVVGKNVAEAKASFEDMIMNARGLKGNKHKVMYDLEIVTISIKKVINA